ncbi:serine/threonine-protein kinase Sgk2 [Metarhizium album ARSEF 1941]|uniref:EKC/KEOPS complex subunit BUD32 n=1 Tax=Metarhizium album (strain ARSEF 1941) TaxID=1081103 RepID=A0A0B2WXI3_METAS|nr:serine/threonine-protein kinase Sgk2 [Metarhizium album ARSEF 1941]KHO00997.1 serine/threonine-protein kinase Sgk2 [Metarhizium album ARSEF 1941]
MTLTKHQISVISDHPLNDTLDRFRDKLKLDNFEESPHTRHEDIADLLLALVGSTAAFNLPGPDGTANVAIPLLSIKQHVPGLSRELFFPLVRCVIDETPDIEIWEAVISLIETLSALISPPTRNVISTLDGTPVKSNSSWLADSETRDMIERELFFEIKDCVYRNVDGFWDKFFCTKSWSEEKKQMLEKTMAAYNGKKWKHFPTSPDEKHVWAWLQSLEASCLTGAQNKLYTTRTANQFKERKGQMDLFFRRPTGKDNSTFTYKDVLIVGEQKKSIGKFKATLLQLTRYVRSVFADQPTRRFVHGFFLCASTMELWVFDRSGLYSSGTFNIHTEPEKFARALVGYSTMDSEAIGLDTFIERKKGHRYITLRDINSKELRIELKNLLVRHKAIVCRGTTCYQTQNGNVAKLSWASDKRTLEVEHLKLVAQRGVKGVARLELYHQITSIADMRKGLVFPKPHRFHDLASRNMATEVKSSQAVGSESIHKLAHKRRLSSDDASRSKRSRLNRQRSNLIRRSDDRSNGKAKPSLYPSTFGNAFENRIYSCLVVSPAGRVICDFLSVRELLEALRDAIKAHQSLYTTGNILHRDISPNNIIITDTKAANANGCRGMLIDLDLAKVRDSGPSRARHQTGTMQFIAIEVLQNVDHTYRHDLESFFYVLLWMCARYSWINSFGGTNKAPRESMLRKWEAGRFKDIADAKQGHMTVNELERILDEFPNSFHAVKPLCFKIRSIMFGETARLNIGTPAGEPDQLYNAVIGAFDEAINELFK